MRPNIMTNVLTVACSALLFASCKEPTTPSDSRDAGASRGSAWAEPSTPAAVSVPLDAPAFQIRATLEPFFINQAPDLMIRSHTRADMIIQRLVTQPSPPDFQGWHTHPGPSFGIVDQGRVEITRVTKQGCLTTVYEAGQAYYEVADEVHRAKVLAPDAAVEYKVRFNTPVGMPFSAPYTGTVSC